MKDSFNTLDWHDAILQSIKIDRRNPGNQDLIELEIVWPNNQSETIVFEDVYWSKMTMNFGVFAEECVYEAHVVTDDDQDMLNLKEKWKDVISQGFVCYFIKTASTGSEIKIIARNFFVTK